MTIPLDLYEEFLETMPDAAVIADERGQIVFANQVAGTMFGRDTASLRGQPLETLLPNAARGTHRAAVRSFFEEPRHRPMGANRNLIAHRADGGEVPVDIMLRPLAIDGRTLALAVLRDISDRRQLEDSLRVAAEREHRLALTDHLTGAANARAFVEAATREVERLRRYGHAFGLCYVDLDRFKAVNDQFGHGAGDELLRTVVRSIAAGLRSTDLLARLGGDELALLLPETGAEGASATAEKIRADIADAMAARGWPVTASVGALVCERPPGHVDELIRAADALMYQAKAGGRNRVASGRFPAAPAPGPRPATRIPAGSHGE